MPQATSLRKRATGFEWSFRRLYSAAGNLAAAVITAGGFGLISGGYGDAERLGVQKNSPL